MTIFALLFLATDAALRRLKLTLAEWLVLEASSAPHDRDAISAADAVRRLKDRSTARETA